MLFQYSIISLVLSDEVLSFTRHVRYVAFLWENYFPTHDEFCEVEGKLMREFLGDGIASQPAGEALEKLSGRTATYREACFA